jgi:ABC-type transport system involved in multi-copper enzyme maturation permease subunit
MAAHTEWSRMLAEHGLFGVVSLCILLLVPLFHAFTMPIQIRALLIGFLILSFFSMFHAAMRLAIISFLYGLALIIPVREKNSIPRK